MVIAGACLHADAEPLASGTILLEPIEDGWRATILIHSGEITVDAPTFRQAAAAAVDAERALEAASHPA